MHENPTREEIDAIEREIAERDRLDTTRAVGPLICPNGAERIDTSSVPMDNVVELLETRAREAVARRARRDRDQ